MLLEAVTAETRARCVQPACRERTAAELFQFACDESACLRRTGGDGVIDDLQPSELVQSPKLAAAGQAPLLGGEVRPPRHLGYGTGRVTRYTRTQEGR